MDIVSHVKSRFINDSLHKVYYGDEVATFPIYNLSGSMVGYQQYRPDSTKAKKNDPKMGRYFTYTNKLNRGVWGLESWGLSDTLYVTEGIFDACRMTNKGYSAIAVLSNDPKFLSDWFLFIRQMRKVICICDYGKAGLKLAKFGHSAHFMPNEFDLGGASDFYIENEVLNNER